LRALPYSFILIPRPPRAWFSTIIFTSRFHVRAFSNALIERVEISTSLKMLF